MNTIKIVTLIFVLLICDHVIAQKSPVDNQKESKRSPVSIDINTGLYSKLRLKMEYRLNNRDALQFSFSRHYGAVNPGTQIYLEYRYYQLKKKHIEKYFYGKAGYGKAFTLGGNYAIAGAGIGQKVNLSAKEAFFFQFSQGFKICPTISGDIEAGPSSGFRGLFYIIGPGAVIDLNISFGFRFK